MDISHLKRALWIGVLGSLIALPSGCQKRAYLSEEAAGGATQTTTGGGSSARRSESLAYEHVVSLELSKELLPARLREVEAACNADAASNCTILSVSSTALEGIPHGSIRMRLARGGVDAIVATASKDGKVLSRTTEAEDLAQPVADTERELALLTVHRDRLAEFMKSKELKVEQLITVSKELATVQTQIEALSTQRANLRRRIDTELLTINMSVPNADYYSQETPVADALKSFGSDIGEATGMVIRFVAVLLPWLVIIVPGVILLRLFWRRITRWLVRRELRTQAGV